MPRVGHVWDDGLMAPRRPYEELGNVLAALDVADAYNQLLLTQIRVADAKLRSKRDVWPTPSALVNPARRQE